MEEKEETKTRRRNRGTGSYGTCGSSSISFVRVIATAKPQIRTREERRDGRCDTPRCRSRFWLATPTPPITIASGAGFPGGARDPSHLENNSIRLYRGLCKRMTRVSHEGGRATFLRFVAYERLTVVVRWRCGYAGRGGSNHFAISNLIVTLPSRSPNFI